MGLEERMNELTGRGENKPIAWIIDAHRLHLDMMAEIKQLRSSLRDALSILENNGYCGECFWDGESIEDVAYGTKEWPTDCAPLCNSCMNTFKEMV